MWSSLVATVVIVRQAREPQQYICWDMGSPGTQLKEVSHPFSSHSGEWGLFFLESLGNIPDLLGSFLTAKAKLVSGTNIGGVTNHMGLSQHSICRSLNFSFLNFLDLFLKPKYTSHLQGMWVSLIQQRCSLNVHHCK